MSARFERPPMHHERPQRVRKGAHGVRRTFRSEAGADLDRALSGVARRGRGIDDRSGHRGHPPARRDDGARCGRDVPRGLSDLRVEIVPRKAVLARADEWIYAANHGRRGDLCSRQHEGADRESQPADPAARVRGYCRRQGYEVVERFHEEGESAKTTDRSQLQKLLTFCRLNKGRVHFVVVFNLTRFARNPPSPCGLRRARQVRPFRAPLSVAVVRHLAAVRDGTGR